MGKRNSEKYLVCLLTIASITGVLLRTESPPLLVLVPTLVLELLVVSLALLWSRPHDSKQRTIN